MERRPPDSILIVDDDAHSRDILDLWLRRANYQCTTAVDGFNALEKIKVSNFSLVLSDLRMPGMDGLELFRLTKEIDSNIALILISAFIDLDVAMKAMKLGASTISRPFALNQITIEVERALAQREISMRHLFYNNEP